MGQSIATLSHTLFSMVRVYYAFLCKHWKPGIVIIPIYHQFWQYRLSWQSVVLSTDDKVNIINSMTMLWSYAKPLIFSYLPLKKWLFLWKNWVNFNFMSVYLLTYFTYFKEITILFWKLLNQSSTFQISCLLVLLQNEHFESSVA